MKTKRFSTGFDETFGTLYFDEKSFFNTLSEFTPYWQYNPTNAFHADFPGVSTSDKILNLSTIDRINLKCYVIDGSVVNG